MGFKGSSNGPIGAAEISTRVTGTLELAVTPGRYRKQNQPRLLPAYFLTSHVVPLYLHVCIDTYCTGTHYTVKDISVTRALSVLMGK